jgi:hypothetical protein
MKPNGAKGLHETIRSFDPLLADVTATVRSLQLGFATHDRLPLVRSPGDQLRLRIATGLYRCGKASRGLV